MECFYCFEQHFKVLDSLSNKQYIYEGSNWRKNQLSQLYCYCSGNMVACSWIRYVCKPIMSQSPYHRNWKKYSQPCSRIPFKMYQILHNLTTIDTRNWFSFLKKYKYSYFLGNKITKNKKISNIDQWLDFLLREYLSKEILLFSSQCCPSYNKFFID